MNYINMPNWEFLKLQLKIAEQEVNCTEKMLQSKKAKVESLKQLLESHTFEPPACINTPEQPHSNAPQIIVFKNGTVLSNANLQNIKECEYDLILDMTTKSLKYRKDPASKSKLLESKLEGVGPERIQPLAYLLEHPNRYYSIENSQTTTTTLSQTIRILRKAIEQKGPKGSYIETVGRWEGSSNTAYRLVTKWQYLLIKENY